MSRQPRPPSAVKTEARRSLPTAAPPVAPPPPPELAAAPEPEAPPAPPAPCASLWREHWVPLVAVFHLALAVR